MTSGHRTTSNLQLEENKIFVGGLHANTTKESLRNYFLQFGEIEDSTVMFDKETNRSRGFGFVKFKDAESVKVACDPRHNHRLDEKKIDPKPAYEKGAEATVQEKLHSQKIYVGGLPQDTKEDQVKQYFSQFGEVEHVVFKYDAPTGRMRGFGFVDFIEKESAEKAIVKSFQEFNGKTVEVKPAEVRKKKETPYSGQHQMAYESSGQYPGYGRGPEFGFNQQGYPPHHNPGYQQGYPPYGYGGNTGGGYSQGGYGGYQASQDYTGYGRPSYGQGTASYSQGAPYGQGGPSYGQNAPSYGQQDYSYQRTFGSQQQQVTNYPPPPPPPQEVGPQGAAATFNQQRSTYTSNTEAYPGGHPGFGGYGGSGGYDGYNYSGEQQTSQTNTGYGRGAARGGSFGYR